MGFLTSNRSSKPVDKALSRIKTSSKKCNPNNQPEEKLIPLPRRKTFEDIDIDIEMQLKITEGMSDESNCMWLSSDCDSSSFVGSDIWLPLVKSGNPNSTAHDLQVDLKGEFSNEGGVLSDQSVRSHEGRGFSYERFLEDSWIDASSCSSLSAMDDLDRTGSWISTFDLNRESSELMQLKDGLNSTYSNFSSLSYSYRRNPRSESSFSSPSSGTTFSSLSSEFDHDEPLFWPYNQNLYESHELGKSFLCVSPPKDKLARNKVVNELKSAEVKLKKTNSPSANRKSVQLQSGRKPELSQTPKKSSTGWKSMAPTRKNYNNSQRPPSQLSTSVARASAKLSPSNASTKKRMMMNSSMKVTPQLKSMNQRNKVEEMPRISLLGFEASFFHGVFAKGATIEALVGLNEFDGDEWLNFKVREDCFIESMKKEGSSSSRVGGESFLLPLFGTTL